MTGQEDEKVKDKLTNDTGDELEICRVSIQQTDTNGLEYPRQYKKFSNKSLPSVYAVEHGKGTYSIISGPIEYERSTSSYTGVVAIRKYHCLSKYWEKKNRRNGQETC